MRVGRPPRRNLSCAPFDRAFLDTTSKADSRVNWNAGFIRQAGEWHWGCRMNPAFRWWCQEAPVFDAPACTWRCAGEPFGFALGSLPEGVKSEN